MDEKSFREFISDTFLFKDITENELENLVLESTEVVFDKNEMIYKSGSYVSHVYYLLDGHAKIFLDADGKEGIVKLVKPGWFIGLLSIFAYETYQFSAAAVEKCIVREIKTSALKGIIMENPLFALKFIKEISLLSNDLTRYLVLKYQKNVRGRLADILLHLSENIYKSNSFKLSFTRRELGSLANTSTESIIRMLSDFRSNGLISFDGQLIIINDHEALRRESEIGK